jgi:hypothetical protein
MKNESLGSDLVDFFRKSPLFDSNINLDRDVDDTQSGVKNRKYQRGKLLPSGSK